MSKLIKDTASREYFPVERTWLRPLCWIGIHRRECYFGDTIVEDDTGTRFAMRHEKFYCRFCTTPSKNSVKTLVSTYRE